MAGTKAGSLKRRETMIKKYGSEEAYIEALRKSGRKGGLMITENTKNKGFGYKSS